VISINADSYAERDFRALGNHKSRAKVYCPVFFAKERVRSTAEHGVSSQMNRKWLVIMAISKYEAGDLVMLSLPGVLEIV